MGPLNIEILPYGAWVVVDSAPIIYVIESNLEFGPRFRPVFEAHEVGALRLAVTTIAMAEVLAGPLKVGDEVLARRYRAILESWRVIVLNADIAESAARLRVAYRLKLPDAVQAASALAINAAALVTNDRHFTRLESLTVLS